MKIVLDTTALLLAFFFDGYPRQLIEAVVQERIAAYATREILEEYEAAVAKMKSGKKGRLNPNLLFPFTSRLHIVRSKCRNALCLNPDDDKFVACAKAANAIYIVNDGKKVSFIGSHKSTKVLPAELACLLLTLCK